MERAYFQVEDALAQGEQHGSNRRDLSCLNSQLTPLSLKCELNSARDTPAGRSPNLGNKLLLVKIETQSIRKKPRRSWPAACSK